MNTLVKTRGEGGIMKYSRKKEKLTARKRHSRPLQPQSQQPLCQLVIVVPQNIALMDKVPSHRFHLQCPDRIQIGLDWLLPLTRVLLQPSRRDRPGIDQCVVED